MNFAFGGEPLAIYIFSLLMIRLHTFFLLPMHLYCVLNKNYSYRICSMQYKLYPLKTLHLFFPFDRKVLCAMCIMLRCTLYVYWWHMSVISEYYTNLAIRKGNRTWSRLKKNQKDFTCMWKEKKINETVLSNVTNSW